MAGVLRLQVELEVRRTNQTAERGESDTPRANGRAELRDSSGRTTYTTNHRGALFC